MSRSNTLGPTGIIPYDEYLRKIQETVIPDDPLSYEKYLRKNLVDYRPDAPFFESDQVRDPSDRGSGFGSRERLSMQYDGTRAGVSPDLPDGTFLDHEFMERDPRGTLNMPDFAAARAQREARGKFIKFSNDNDYSVPETGINPVQMVSLIRGSQQQFKDRYTNFEESFDSWHNGSAAQRGGTSTVEMVQHDGTILNLASATQRQRTDPVNLLSNRVPGIPRWTEPDHRVKISKYGLVKPVLDIGANNWNENRTNSYLDHAIPIELNGQMVNRMLANLILDIEGQRLTKQAAAQGADYSESEVTQIRNSRKVLNPDDVFKLIAIGLASQTQAPSAHNLYYSTEFRNRGKQQTLDVRKMLGQTQINHHMAASMLQANRTLGPQEQKDLRDSIIASGAHHHHMVEQNTASKVKLVTNTNAREGLSTSHMEDSLGVKVYSTVQPQAKPSNLDVTEYEVFAKKSRENKNVNKNTARSKNKSVTDTEHDMDMPEFNLPGRKEQLDYSHKRFGGRSIQADYGDTNRADSSGKLDLHDVLLTMVTQD